MKSRNLGKWTTFCVVAVVFAASGQACPPEMPPPPGPVSTLAGVWTGPVSGEATRSTRFNDLTSPNPNDQTSDSAFETAGTVQIVVNDSVRLVSVPLVFSAFFDLFSQQAVTVFNVGETQTISSTFSDTFPTGAADTVTFEFSITTTLTVIESVVTMDHFRVVYETSFILMSSQTSTDPMSTPSSSTRSSTGTLTLDATAVGGLVMFSADFNINGSSENMTGGTTTQTGNGFVVGSLTGTLAAN